VKVGHFIEFVMVEEDWNMQTNYTNDNKVPKKVHFEVKHTPVLQQPSFFIAPYRTFPLNPLPIPPVPKWKHAYMHVTSRVNSYRK